MEWLSGFVVWLLSEDWFRGALLFFGTTGAFIAIWNARRIARKKQTCDALFACRNDEGFKSGLVCVGRVHASDNANIQSFAKNTKVDCDERKDILYILNHYEYVSVGIQHGIYDEKMFKEAQYGTVVSLYAKTTAFIDELRKETGRPTLFQEFIWLGKRWNSKPLKKRNENGR